VPWDRTFKVNIYSYFWTTRAAMRHMPDGGTIINTASINGDRPVLWSYVFFARGRLSSYYSGEVLAPIGRETLPG
jgi:NAD(P)-dependent dehydrogenase (short-subunit alcohol dehydrogenase family)